MRMRLLVIDDHEVVREGLMATLGDRYDVAAAVSTGGEALAWLRSGSADVALVDFKLADMGGDVVCERLLEIAPDIVVVILSTYSSPEIARRAIRAGALAYVTKSAGLPALREVLDTIERNAANPPPEGAGSGQIVEQLHALISTREASVQLTPQQESVLELASLGLTNREIGARLFISESTVRFHLQKLKAKLSARSKTDLIARAIRRGLITPAEDAVG